MARKYIKRNEAYWGTKQGAKNMEEETLRKIKALDHAKSQNLHDDEKNLREFVVDGKNRETREQEIQKIRELEELIGISKANPFGTADKEVFAASLEEKTKTDLENLCMRVGIPPRMSVEATKEALKKEFIHFSSKHGTSLPGEVKLAVPPDSEEAKIIKQLSEN